MARSLRPVLLVLLPLLLAACGGDDGPANSAGNAAQSDSTGAAQGESIEQLLERANRALAEKRLFDPADDNAMALFLQVAERKDAATEEPGRRRLMDSVAGGSPQQRARSAMTDLLPQGLTRVQQAIRDGEMKEAQRVLGMLEKAAPEAGSVQRLRQDFTTAYARWRANLKSSDPNKLPALLSKTMPTYPARAQRKGIEGWVFMRYEIKPDGTVGDVEVLDSEPAHTFDSEAVKALKLWKFQPPGRTIRAERRTEFKLDGDDEE